MALSLASEGVFGIGDGTRGLVGDPYLPRLLKVLTRFTMFCCTSVLLFCLGIYAHAAIITYDFNITWVTANPDGMFARPVMGINGQWPLPEIRATVGDRLVINVLNLLGNQSTSLHFHGLYMNGTTQMDGPVGVSQCGIPPGNLFTYNFTVSLTMTLEVNRLQSC